MSVGRFVILRMSVVAVYAGGHERYTIEPSRVWRHRMYSNIVSPRRQLVQQKQLG
jgi:hypothetical protein